MLAKLKLAPKQLISQLQVQIGKAKIPRVLLGTSPFIGAGQFGRRAYEYYTKFYEHPENIVRIVLKAVDLGVTGIQALSSRPIFAALKAAERELKERLTVVATIGPDTPLDDIREFQRFNTVAMLLHGEITDRRKDREISELLNKVHSANCLAGLVTHRPLSMLNWLSAQSWKDDVDLVMLSFNSLGMFMDATPQKVAESIRKLGKPVIGKKTLAAGYLSPKEAFKFVADSGCIDIIAVGIASEQEATETFTAAAAAFSGKIRL